MDPATIMAILTPIVRGIIQLYQQAGLSAQEIEQQFKEIILDIEERDPSELPDV